LILSNKELQKFYFGAYSFEETEDGYLKAFQYSKPQIEYFKKVSEFWYERCLASSGKTLEFKTTATKISFDINISWIGTCDTIELLIDGLISKIVYIKDCNKKDTITFDMNEGMKDVIIYLPSDSTVDIKNFEINDDNATAPIKKEKVLWLGDSITQGYGTFRSAHMYVSVANRLLGYNIINQGIGGYVYDKNSLMKMPGYTPDKIIVALGTNQYGTEDMTDIEEYYERLFEIYKKDIPVLTITPLWRGDNVEGIPKLCDFCDKLKEICKRYSNITIVDGFKLLPHLEEYYIDNLHPNELGGEMYGRNLVLEINKVNF